MVGILLTFFIPQFSLARTPAEKQFEFAYELYKSGQFELATQEFQRFINTFPDNKNCSIAQFYIGKCYYNQEEYKKAASIFEKILLKCLDFSCIRKSEGKEAPSSKFRGPVSTRGILRMVEPIYPEWAKRQGIEGNVELKFWVLPSGEVSSIEVFEGSGRPSLDRVAADALSQWKFESIKEDVIQWGIITFRFRLKNKK